MMNSKILSSNSIINVPILQAWISTAAWWNLLHCRFQSLLWFLVRSIDRVPERWINGTASKLIPSQLVSQSFIWHYKKITLNNFWVTILRSGLVYTFSFLPTILSPILTKIIESKRKKQQLNHLYDEEHCCCHSESQLLSWNGNLKKIKIK